MHFGIAKLETPTRRQVSLWASCQQIREGRKLHCVGDSMSAYRDLEDRKSHEQLHFGIGNPETPMRDKTAVMGIVVIWARILARRANA
jgi:hypothetical protein